MLQKAFPFIVILVMLVGVALVILVLDHERVDEFDDDAYRDKIMLQFCYFQLTDVVVSCLEWNAAFTLMYGEPAVDRCVFAYAPASANMLLCMNRIVEGGE